jgi:hypothetical protein
MKIKDLPKDKQLQGIKIKIPKDKILEGMKKEMYIYSGWNKGLWLKKKMTDSQIYPFFFDSFKDLGNLEVRYE